MEIAKASKHDAGLKGTESACFGNLGRGTSTAAKLEYDFILVLNLGEFFPHSAWFGLHRCIPYHHFPLKTFDNLFVVVEGRKLNISLGDLHV